MRLKRHIDPLKEEDADDWDGGEQACCETSGTDLDLIYTSLCRVDPICPLASQKAHRSLTHATTDAEGSSVVAVGVETIRV